MKTGMNTIAFAAGALVMTTVIAATAIAPAALAQDKPALTKAEIEKTVAEGKKVFSQCAACHQVGEKARNAVGPKLNGLFQRSSGEVEGYNYSAANKTAHVKWTEEYFTKYIQNPRAVMPGNKMAYAGLKGETAPARIKALIAYLNLFDKDGKMPNPAN